MENTIKITTKNTNNYYSILLHTNQSLMEFRTNSNMSSQYTAEYQHHYWFANLRFKADIEILDINIPLVMFNYPQEVSGASVKFHLEQVQDKSEELKELAQLQMERLLASDFFKAIKEVFPVEASIIPMGTLHVHPSGIRNFSGTDYKTDPNNPGIVYPFMKVSIDDMPSLSSIVIHEDELNKIVRTESCLVNSTKEKIVYSKGKTITFVRGSSPELKPIQSMFEEKEIFESYYVKNGINDINYMVQGIIDLWDKSEFQIDTSNITSDNILTKNDMSEKLKSDNTVNNYGKYFNRPLVNDNEPMTVLDKIFYKGVTYDEDEIDDIREQMIQAGLFDERKLMLMNSNKVIKIWVDEEIESWNI